MAKGKAFENFSESKKDSLVENLGSFMSWFEKTFGNDIYLQYGTLLGALREKNLISRDNDIDLAYLSKYNTISEVYEEMLQIYLKCEELGVLYSRGEGSGYKRNCGHAHIYLPKTFDVYDVWTSWIGKDGKYYFWSMGNGLKSNVLLPFSKAILRGHQFKVPHRSKEVLKYLYTLDWKVPMNRKSYYYRKHYLSPLYELIKKDTDEC